MPSATRLALLCALPALSAALAPPLRRALKGPKPLVIELLVEDAGSAWELDVQELSARLRTAGAAALITPRTLLGAFATEQASSKGSFPGPLPLLCEVDGDGWEAALGTAQEAGAAGLAVRCGSESGADELRRLLDGTAAAGLECLVVAGAPELLGIAQAGGATAVACDYEAATAANSDAGEAIILGGWDGDDGELARLRAAGFGGLVLLDGVGGEIADGAPYCEGRVRTHRSKASKEWAGSMFASTSGDVATPAERNPRMWAQSQRQAREMMHESAKSRGLAPPKIKRNTVL